MRRFLFLLIATLVCTAPAAAQENPHCTPCEGSQYLREGIYPKAFDIFQTLSAQGNATAMNNLGYMYQHGLGVQADYAQAMRWYQQSARFGDSMAMNQLGFMYQHGLGVAQDNEEARHWYEKAIALGNKDAKTHLQELDIGE